MPSASEIKAGAAYVELYLRDNRLTRGLLGARRKLRALGAGFQRLGARTMALGAGIVAPLVAASKVFASMGDQLAKMHARTGVSVESLSELGFAAEQSGSSINTLEKGIKGTQRTLRNAERGLSTAVDALDAIGLSYDDLAGKSPEEQFLRVADALAGIEDDSRRAALAMEIMGRPGQELLPLINEGRAGIEALKEQARGLGLTISGEDAAKAAQFTDQMNILWRVLKMGVFRAGSAVAPILLDLVNKMAQGAQKVAGFIQQNEGLIRSALKIGAVVVGVGAGLMALGALLSGLGTVAGIVAGGIMLVGSVIGAVGTVLAAVVSPLGLVTAGLVAGGVALAKYTGGGQAALDWLGETWAALKGRATDALGAITDALAAGDLQLAARVLWAYLKTEWERGTGYLEDKWVALKDRMLTAWTELVYDLRTIIAEGLARVKALVTNFATTVVDGWKKVEEAMATGIAVAIARQQGLNPRDVIRNVQEDYARKRRTRHAARDKTLEGIEEERSDALTRLTKDREKALASRGKERDARVAQAEADLAKAQAELDALKAEARRKALEAPAMGENWIAPGLDTGGAAEGALAAGQTLKTGILGTFSAAAAQLMGGARPTEERIAKATEETARNTTQLNQRVRTGGRITWGK